MNGVRYSEMTKRYYWLKLGENFFAEKEIKKLRKIAGGDTYTIIYLKLMLLSLKTEGKLYYDGVEDTFYEEMALIIDEDADNVRVAMNFMLNTGLMEEVSESVVNLTRISEMVGSESDSAKRVREHRERKRLEECGKKALQCNTTVTTCNTEIRDKSKSKSKSNISNDIVDEIVASYNGLCVSMPRVERVTDARRTKVKARLKTFSEDKIKLAFIKAEESDFLTGRDGKWNGANFDWLMKNDTNLAKVLEGNYENRSKGNKYDDAKRRLDDMFGGA